MHPIPHRAIHDRLVLAGMTLALMRGQADVHRVPKDLVQRALSNGRPWRKVPDSVVHDLVR
jgi:hypothetical protein